MSSEVCPFCGKSYKRLKSHLPHCKAAPCVTKHPSQQDPAPANRTAAAAAQTDLPRTKTKKSVKTTLRQSESNDDRIPLTSSSMSSSSSRATASPDTRASSTKKQQSRDEQVKTTSTSAKPKKKSVRELLEAANRTESRHESIGSQSTPRSTAQILTKPSRDPSKPTSSKKASKQAPLASPKPLRTPDRQASKGEEEKQKPPKRCNFWEDEEELESDEQLQQGGGAQRATISLQSVKATLGRHGVRPTSNRLSLPSHTHTHQPNTHLPPPTGLASEAKTEKSVAEQPRLNTQTSSNLKNSTSARAIAPAPTLPPPPPPQRHVTGTFTKSSPLSQVSRPLRFPVTLQALPVNVQLVATQSQTEGALAHKRLGMVKLRELPDWLAGRTPSRPRDVVEMVQRGWQWYYRKYIDVRKGGVAGVGMLLAAYCTLSYIWSYPHIKLDRWRKYH